MADLSITATAVVAASDAQIDYGSVLGETVTAGQALYKDSTTGKWMKADANAGSAEARQATHMALNGGAVNQPCAALKRGDVTLNAVLTAGLAYYLSDTAGGICPVADIGSGEYVVLLGLAKSTTLFSWDPKYPNVAL